MAKKIISVAFLVFYDISYDITIFNRIGGVMVSVLASNVLDRGFEPRSGKTKDYEIGICCFSVNHAALRRKSYKNPTKRVGLVQSGFHHHLIENCLILSMI